MASNPIQSQSFELSRSQRLSSAVFGAFLTSLLTTPFDVLKVRQQTLSSNSSPCVRIFLGLNEGELWCYKCNSSNCGPTRIFGKFSVSNSSTAGMFLQILRSEGGWHLWRGLGPTLMMSIPSTVIYFNMYDELKTSFGNSQFSPLFAGVFARVIAVTLVAPIELIRTRTQAVRGGKDTQVFKSSLQTLSEEVRALGPRALFRGLSSTLWRDIPFSGIYWLGYEKIKAMLKDDYKWEGTFKVSFASGAASGMFTALVTTPFDVVKTRQQVEMMQILRDQANKEAKVHNGTTPFFKLLTSIYQQEGISGLFAGTAARLSKVAPACAIMISSYEMFKSHFSTRNNSI